MSSNCLVRRTLGMAVMGILWVGCFDEPSAVDLSPPEVFTDGFVQSEFQAFGGSKYDALGTDALEKYAGGVSLKVSVPTPSDPSGSFAGGAFVATRARDLSVYNALTFYAKASAAVVVGELGLGNDNTGNSRFPVSWKKVPLTTSWTRYVIPLPLGAKLSAEKGLFFFAAATTGAAYSLWLDEIRYEKLGTSVLGPPRPAITAETARKEVGDSFTATDVSVTWSVDGVDQKISAALPYYTWVSSAPAVATVDTEGKIRAVGPGTATITASLGSVAATGAVTVQVSTAVLPTTKAPTPTQVAADVLSLFSGAYTNVTVDTFRADWSNAGPVTDLQVAGDSVKRYSGLNYAGIDFSTHLLDASAMGFFHLDFWTADSTVFKVKLVDFGADGVFGGGDDKEHELSFTPTSTPPLATSSWVSLDLPFSAFSGLTTRAHLAQVVLSASNSTVFVDNVYFHK